MKKFCIFVILLVITTLSWGGEIERIQAKGDTTHEKFARQLFPAKAIKPYPTAAAAAEALINGDVDAMVADSPFVQVWRNTHLEHYQKIAAFLMYILPRFDKRRLR